MTVEVGKGYRYQLNYCLLGGMNGGGGRMQDAKKLGNVGRGGLDLSQAGLRTKGGSGKRQYRTVVAVIPNGMSGRNNQHYIPEKRIYPGGRGEAVST
jgi:hypothetical protein